MTSGLRFLPGPLPRRMAVTFGVTACFVLLYGDGASAQDREAPRQTNRSSGSSCEAVPIDSLESAGSLARALESRVAGLNILPGNSRAGGGSSLRLRGNASVSSSNEPLIVIDDVPMFPVRTSPIDRHMASEPAMNPLDFVDVADIEHVDVLRGPAAATLYGMLASNGVIRIYTKRGSEKGGGKANSSVRCPN